MLVLCSPCPLAANQPETIPVPETGGGSARIFHTPAVPCLGGSPSVTVLTTSHSGKEFIRNQLAPMTGVGSIPALQVPLIGAGEFWQSWGVGELEHKERNGIKGIQRDTV